MRSNHLSAAALLFAHAVRVNRCAVLIQTTLSGGISRALLKRYSSAEAAMRVDTLWGVATACVAIFAVAGGAK